MISRYIAFASALVISATLGAAESIPAQMQAIRADSSSGTSVMKLQTVDVPAPKEGQALIRVYAASANPSDWRQGGGGPPGGGAPGGAPGAGSPPGGGAAGGARMGGGGARAPGNDVAGVVVALGPNVTMYKVGDKIVAALQQSGGGAYAEYALVNVENSSLKPTKFTFEQSAAIPTAGFTGLRMVILGNVQKGERVLVIGAAGGVGSTAVQAAKARGAYVITSASSKHNAYLKKIGADLIIAYDKEKVGEKATSVDVVINSVGSENAASIGYVKRGGRVITIAGASDAAACTAAGVSCMTGGPGQGPSIGDLIKELVQMANAGKYEVAIEKSFPLADVQQAFEYGRTGNREGKIAIAVKDATTR